MKDYIMIEPLLVSSSLLIGKELFAHTISKTSQNIYKNVNELMADEDFEFKKILENMDITIKLNIIHEFIDDLEKKNKNLIHINKSLNISLKNCISIIKNIENEIEDINKKIKYHKSKWLYKFRSNDYRSLIENLILNFKHLDERFNLFLKLLQFYSKK